MSGGKQQQTRKAGEVRKAQKAAPGTTARPPGTPSGAPSGGRRSIAGSWLGGVRSAGVDLGYPGERLGLAKEGRGAAGSYGRRLVALLIDLLVSALAAAFLAALLHWSPAEKSWGSTVIFGVQAWLLTGLTGATIGKMMLGLRVVRLDGRPMGLVWSLVRAILLVLVVPALLWDRDYRGLHDRAANTIVIRV